MNGYKFYYKTVTVNANGSETIGSLQDIESLVTGASGQQIIFVKEVSNLGDCSERETYTERYPERSKPSVFIPADGHGKTTEVSVTIAFLDQTGASSYAKIHQAYMAVVEAFSSNEIIYLDTFRELKARLLFKKPTKVADRGGANQPYRIDKFVFTNLSDHADHITDNDINT